jgi:hypothetical protein
VGDRARWQTLPRRRGGERSGGSGPRNSSPAVAVLAARHQAVPGPCLFPSRLQPRSATRRPTILRPTTRRVSITPRRSSVRSPVAPSCSPIHPSARKRNSANFACTAFSEVRHARSAVSATHSRERRRSRDRRSDRRATRPDAECPPAGSPTAPVWRNSSRFRSRTR